ncbi:class I SAM-dependent methyltransferase [uncultured Streptomyces sp.]|uniref:class I SAM-dependent methyltransferase n=1 Tax=uncultured Streptomyces sp. TaxID=174707 RepID=UPI00261E5290|nr:class I SAM-dependent methyltransferase [uncultured Streptomyces sp.]
MVAAARAIETHRPDALARDVYAEHFVRAAPASAGWPVRAEEVPDGDANPLWGRMARYFGLRTRVLDDFLLGAVRSGPRQVVILGAGLDARAFRLDWPAGCVVFEIDREGVLGFKQEVLGSLSAVPTAVRVPVPVDLRDDWAGALADAGFDAAQPSVWLAEGLLFYLPSAAESRLVGQVDRLSTAGSAMAFEIKLDQALLDAGEHPLYTSATTQMGIDLLGLFDREPRPDSVGDLTGRGWTTAVHTAFEFTRHHGRGPLPVPDDGLGGNRWVFATKPVPLPRPQQAPHS